jgi:hypothetical protein
MFNVLKIPKTLRFLAIGIIHYQQYSTNSFHSDGKDPEKQIAVNIDS